MRRLAWLLALVSPLAGCSDSADPAGPDPVPDGPPVVEYFVATDTSLLHGEWTQLRWRIAGASAASVAPEVGPLSPPAQGALSVRPVGPRTYTLSASNPHGTVTATVTVEVAYPSGVYVDSVHGDDGRTGDSPENAIRTLAEAMIRTAGGGAIFLSAGVYDSPIVIDGPDRSIFGGLNPETFFEEGAAYETWVRPAGADVPLEVRNSSIGTSLLSRVKFDARNGGGVAADVLDANVVFADCTFEARRSGSGTALRVRGTSDVQAARCRVHGGRDGTGSPVHAHARGIEVRDSASLLATASFIDGGWAGQSCSGVDIETTGTVRLGFNTICAQLSGGVTADIAAAVRIRAGRPALGGNILLTRGSAERHAIAEDSADADPSWMLGNLFVSAGTPPYDNFDGADPADETQLNSSDFVNGEPGTLYGNRLASGVALADMFVNVDQADFHLISPLASGGANPAVNRGDPLFLNPELFGDQPRDVDGQSRPGSALQFDLGADEN